MKITTKGQVTIPMKMRRRFGLQPHTEVIFEEKNGDLVVRAKESRRERFLRGLAKATGSATTGMTTDEIMRLTRGED
jgi:antitoxin PrlF